jgi:hypothetical protein
MTASEGVKAAVRAYRKQVENETAQTTERGTMPDLETEKVTENYQPEPGQMDTRTFWIAYPSHVAGYGHTEDRISRATGRGKTRKAALADAEINATGGA